MESHKRAISCSGLITLLGRIAQNSPSRETARVARSADKDVLNVSDRTVAVGDLAREVEEYHRPWVSYPDANETQDESSAETSC